MYRLPTGITMQDMGKLIHELTVPVHKLEHGLDIHLGQGLEKGIVDFFIDAGIRQMPAAASFDFNVFILTRGNPLIHLLEPASPTTL